MNNQAEVYRIPSNPGFLGSYDWRSSVSGLLLITLSCFFATEYIAKRLRFHAELGTPMFRVGKYSYYEPFEWVAWGWRYCTSRDREIREPLFRGEMIAFGGCLLTAFGFFVLANRRAQKLSENAEEVHGSARWANPDDVQETGLIAATGGVYVGGWREQSSNRLRYLRHNGPEHVLAFAPTRSGKGVSLVIPTLLAWEESAVIYDIKGENWAKTAGFRASQGHLCFKFSPVEPNSSSRFNPLQEVRIFTARDVSDAQNIAKMIVWNGQDATVDKYWKETAESIMTVGITLKIPHALTFTRYRRSRNTLTHRQTSWDSNISGPGRRNCFTRRNFRQVRWRGTLPLCVSFLSKRSGALIRWMQFPIQRDRAGFPQSSRRMRPRD